MLCPFILLGNIPRPRQIFQRHRVAALELHIYMSSMSLVCFTCAVLTMTCVCCIIASVQYSSGAVGNYAAAPAVAQQFIRTVLGQFENNQLFLQIFKSSLKSESYHILVAGQLGPLFASFVTMWNLEKRCFQLCPSSGLKKSRVSGG